tara:strand:- start:584 stop:961 length:378 start_codon:yes stop_codon:yes gene_type:complete
MALSDDEREMITRLVDSQMRVEMAVAQLFSRPTMGLAPALMRMSHEDPFDSPLILDREERIALLNKTGDTARRTGRKIRKKAKRKVSPYQREFGRQLIKLKKKHPRTKVGVLMKRAHRATKKVRK